MPKFSITISARLEEGQKDDLVHLIARYLTDHTDTFLIQEEPLVDWEVDFPHEHVYDEYSPVLCHYTAPNGEMCGYSKEEV